MKSYCKIFGIIGLVAAMAGCGDKGADPDTVGAAPYRILAIGNSFSEDAMRYMRDILVKNGVVIRNIDIVNAYIGGQTLAGHATNAQSNWALYTRESFGTKGDITSINSVTLKAIIASNDWDYITLQQASGDSGKPATYKDTEIESLLDYIKEHSTNPNVKIGWHMTWAYAGTYDNSAFDGYGRNQTTMYNAIVQTVQDKIVPNDGFDFIIPSGTAIQNARTVYGDTLNSDGTHLNDTGRFIAGAMWLKKIYGMNVDVFTSPYQALNGYTITLDDIEKIKQCVQDACDAPFEVTDQQGQ